MRKSLFSKMVTVYTMIIAASFIFIAGILSLWFEKYFIESRKEQLVNESQFINDYVIKYINRDKDVTLTKLNDILDLYSRSSKSEIWLTDAYGIIYAVSNEEHKDVLLSSISGKDLEEIRLNRIQEKSGIVDGWFSMPMNIYEIPIFDSYKFSGSVIMSTSMDDIKEPMNKVFTIIWVSAVFAIISSCIVTYYFSQKIIIKPLAEINYVAGKISKGEVEKRVNIVSNDEIGELVKSFNSMADSLEQIERNRRNFISNVSHEIRSPITSIKGFIGGILDGVIPKEKQNYYLSMTYEEIQRLTRLVNDLLDLSAIEAGQLSIKKERLDINEIIRISVIKFETKINSKKLKVDVCFNQDNLYVIGDRDRIIQVITNLVDNAIKYVTEGGNIRVTTKTKGEKAYISVFNDGPVISKEDVKHIWDRFYKADKSRTSKISTGLGLPIVRSILTQHGEDIWVENKEKEGVTFTFTLKRD